MKNLPWIAVVFSFWLPFRAARVYARNDAFHYSALCLFGMVWAFLFPFWFGENQYIFGVYSGFLLTLVGCLLTKVPVTPAIPLAWTLRLAVLVLAFGVYGGLNGYRIPLAPSEPPVVLTAQQAGLLSAIALDIFGFIAVARALRDPGQWLDKMLTVSTFLYVAVEVWYCLSIFQICDSPGHAGPLFPVVFAILKAGYSAVVVSLIVKRCWSPDDAALPFSERLLKLVTG